MRPMPPPSEPIRTGYLLVDASNLDDETFADNLPMLPCTPAVLSNSDQLMPRLIDVAALAPAQQDGLSDVLLRELSEQRQPAVCAWLDCAIDADALARHLSRYLVGPGPEGVQVFWRNFDPRVFSLTVALFSREQREALLGPVVEWRLPWCRRWWSVRGPGREADPLMGKTPAWPSAKQWAKLEYSDSIARVLATVQDARAPDDPLTNAACLRLQREIAASMQNASERLGLSDKDDLMEHALRHLREGEEHELSNQLAASRWYP